MKIIYTVRDPGDRAANDPSLIGNFECCHCRSIFRLDEDEAKHNPLPHGPGFDWYVHCPVCGTPTELSPVAHEAAEAWLKEHPETLPF